MATYTCAECQNAFESQRYQPKYCSRACCHANFRRRSLESGQRVALTCTQCGCNYDKAVSSTQRVEKPFCSRACKIAWWKVNAPRGEAHHQYNRITAACEACGKDFTMPPSSAARGRFCSLACYHSTMADRAPVALPCAQCGTMTMKQICNVEQRKRIYCSRGCHDAWRREHGPRGRESPKYSRVAVVCNQCGNVFERNPYRVSKSKHRFCSRACKTAWARSSWPRGAENPHYTTVEVPCAQCGAVLQRQPWQANGYKHQFCDKACHGAWISKHQTGEAAPNWRGGRMVQRPPLSYGPNWKRQRKAARKRDNYTCQHCGITETQLGAQLDVHHKQPFRTFGYIKGQNDHYLVANDLSNLISLCERCHTIEEWWVRQVTAAPSSLTQTEQQHQA
jgi:5-methylcytosine-specific restriction endonuclease McrA